MKRYTPLLLLTALLACQPAPLPPEATPPPGLKVAFFGDQGLGPPSEAVLRLVKEEGAAAVIHVGDFDYENNPAAWETQIDGTLGPDFPYFACIGNHDTEQWGGEAGYQARLMARAQRLGITWDGDYGVKSSFRWNGLSVSLLAPGIAGHSHATWLKEKLATEPCVWRLAVWHKNQHLMQAGGKADETGWEVYDEAREGGALIFTGHEHSYSRSHLLADCEHQKVASRQQPARLTQGTTIVVVTGMGGASERVQKLDGDWWAKIHTKTQGAIPGALFGVFNVDGDPRRAHFYYKDIAGKIIDEYDVISDVAPGGARQ